MRLKQVNKLIHEAEEVLMQLRIKAGKEAITERQLYDVQMLLYKALDELNRTSKKKLED
jgi:hypothetical protein